MEKRTLKNILNRNRKELEFLYKSLDVQTYTSDFELWFDVEKEIFYIEPKYNYKLSEYIVEKRLTSSIIFKEGGVKAIKISRDLTNSLEVLDNFFYVDYSEISKFITRYLPEEVDIDQFLDTVTDFKINIWAEHSVTISDIVNYIYNIPGWQHGYYFKTEKFAKFFERINEYINKNRDILSMHLDALDIKKLFAISSGEGRVIYKFYYIEGLKDPCNNLFHVLFEEALDQMTEIEEKDIGLWAYDLIEKLINFYSVGQLEKISERFREIEYSLNNRKRTFLGNIKEILGIPISSKDLKPEVFKNEERRTTHDARIIMETNPELFYFITGNNYKLKRIKRKIN